MPKGLPNKIYSGEFKIKVVETKRKENLSFKETARQFEIRSDRQVRNWEHIYLKEGKEALLMERRGRACAEHRHAPESAGHGIRKRYDNSSPGFVAGAAVVSWVFQIDTAVFAPEAASGSLSVIAFWNSRISSRYMLTVYRAFAFSISFFRNVETASGMTKSLLPRPARRSATSRLLEQRRSSSSQREA